MYTEINARIRALEEYRGKLVAEANAELARVAGGIAELQRLLEFTPAEQAAAGTQSETAATGGVPPEAGR